MRVSKFVFLIAIFLLAAASSASSQNWSQECAQYRCASTATSLNQCITCNMGAGSWSREQSIQWCNRWMARCKAPGAKSAK